MSQLKEYPGSRADQFILGWYIDPQVCKNMVDLFKSIPEHHRPGQLEGGIDESKKKSTDVVLAIPSNNKVIVEYLGELEKCINLYKKVYPELEYNYSSWAPHNAFLIQWYKPNECYSSLHCERNTWLNSNRMLVFMTYLNTVTDCGETEFKYQNVKIKPEEGLTLIWPSDFTHIHRGIPSPSQDKYIATGWYVFLPMERN